MRKKTLLVLLPAIAIGAAGCNPPLDEGQAFIQGVLPLVGPACVAQAGGITFESSALLDIGIDAGDANNLILPLNVLTNLPSTFSTQQLTQDQARSPNYVNYGNTDENIITFSQSEVFFSTDEDRVVKGKAQLQLGQVNGTPTNRGNERLATVSGVVFNQQTQLLTPGAVFTTVISKGDATLLQSEPFVAGALSAGGFAHIITNIRLKGTTTGGAGIETPLFPFPVDLCAGCLTGKPSCKDSTGATVDPIANDKSCIRGQDEPSLVCPN